MSQILALTGLTGKSGGILAEQIALNMDIINKLFPSGLRFLVRSISNTDRLDKFFPNADMCKGELTDLEFLKNSLKNVDTLFHVAGIRWSKEIVEAAAYNHVRRLVLVHTTGIYSKYKFAGKEYRQIDSFVYDTCKKEGILLTILRPTMIYGNLKDNNVIKFIKMVDKFPIMPVVNGARYELQPVHFSDLGKAYYQVLVNEGKTANKDFILSGQAPIMLRDMLKMIGDNLGKNVHFFNCPFFIAYSMAWIVYGLSLRKKDYREKVQRLCESRVFSHKEATVGFGYCPMSFEDGVKNEIIQYQQRKGELK